MELIKKMIRFYAGKLKCKRISKMTVMKTALYEALEDGIIGSKKLGFREISKGDVFIAPIRRCFKDKKGM